MKKVSVVIPVYNASEYIERTISSIINQTLEKEFFSIIAVNDGSSDDSLEKLQQLQREYPDLLLIVDQENQGVGKARNTGLDKVETPYVCFLDADDTYDSDFLEKMLSEIEKSSADVSISGYRRVNSKGVVTRSYSPQKIGSFTKFVTMVSWNRIHRTAFLRDNNIRFFEDSFVEDTPFSLMEIEKGAKYSFLDYIGYNWTLNEQSFSSTGLKVSNEKNSNQAVELLKLFISLADSMRTEKDFQYYMIKSIFHQLISQGRGAGEKAFMEHYHKAFKMLKEDFPEALKIKGIYIAPKGETFKTGLVVSGMYLVRRMGLMRPVAKIICR